jgi:hypothetical protein
MFKMPLAQTIEIVKDAILPRGTSQRGGDKFWPSLLFTADCELSDPKDNRTLRTTIHFILCGNVKVFCASGERPPAYRLAHQIPLEKWKMTCDHDSCWRGDGINRPINDLFFSMAAELNDKVAPAELHQHVFTVTPFVQKVRVLLEVDPNKDDSGYTKRITKIEYGWTTR